MATTEKTPDEEGKVQVGVIATQLDLLRLMREENDTVNDTVNDIIQGLDKYIRQGEPQQRERSEAWKVAIGLQQVSTQSAKLSDKLLPKCKNCTLEAAW